MLRTLLMVQLLAALPCLATTVYKSVDARGLVTFADDPVDGAVSVERLELNMVTPEISEADLTQRVAMREVATRMIADRKARERERSAAKRPPESVPAQYYGYYPDPVRYYYPVYLSSGRPHHRLAGHHPARGDQHHRKAHRLKPAHNRVQFTGLPRPKPALRAAFMGNAN